MKNIKVSPSYMYHLTPKTEQAEAQLIFVNIAAIGAQDWVFSGEFALALYEGLKNKDVEAAVLKHHKLSNSTQSLSAFKKSFLSFISHLQDAGILVSVASKGAKKSKKSKPIKAKSEKAKLLGKLSKLDLSSLGTIEVHGKYFGPVGCGDHSIYTLGDGGDCGAFPSDLRLKKDVSRLENSLAQIMQLNGVKYDWKDKKSFEHQPKMGLIAQEVEQVFPELVVTHPDSGAKMISYAHLVAPLIEAIKDLSTQVSSQAQQIEELKGLVANQK